MDMPRKATGERLEKVVSTKIGLADFMTLEKYARIYYNKNRVKQPTISHLLRGIIRGWANGRRKEEAELKSRTTSHTTDN